MTIDIEARLEHWADWYTKRAHEGLGYSSHTIEWELHRMGGVLIRADGGRRPLPADPDADEIHDAMCVLRANWPHDILALAIQYAWRDRHWKERIEHVSRIMGRPLQRSAYYYMVDAGRDRLEGYLCGMRKHRA